MMDVLQEPTLSVQWVCHDELCCSHLQKVWMIQRFVCHFFISSKQWKSPYSTLIYSSHYEDCLSVHIFDV